MQLPNVVEFAYLYFALQKIGAIPIMALPPHRYREMSQFVELSGAVACVMPDAPGDFDFRPMVDRVRGDARRCGWRHPGEAPTASCRCATLIDREPTAPTDRAATRSPSIPTDPAVFQLSGGTTGIPKLIPRTHNDYAYNSQGCRAGVRRSGRRRPARVLPIAHNLPLACPGIQGFCSAGAPGGARTTHARPRGVRADRASTA